VQKQTGIAPFLLPTIQSLLVALCLTLISSCSKEDIAVAQTGPKPVVKTNKMKVYMHYMTWFQSKPVSGYWGSHWRMTNRNPDIIDAAGQRQIASHYYPLIGPYDSKDPDVIDYHLLLMKYAGVDGILIDWYGSHTVNDYAKNNVGANATIDRLDETGLSFAMVYEDYTAQYSAVQADNSAIKAARQDMNYAQTNYFSNKQHIYIQDGPLMLTFGPRYLTQGSQWDQVLEEVIPKPEFLGLWDQSGKLGSNASGEFAWVDFDASLSGLDNFYTKSKLKGFDFIIGSAFPRFHDYYVEGGTGSSYGYVDFNNGLTLQNTLARAKANAIDYLQLVTWNDFGEGTIIEPTTEDQFKCLEIIQQFTGVTYGHAELALVYDYFLKKQKYKGDAEVQKTLEKVFLHLTSLEVTEATALLKDITL
jgi:glycoprotein endo-alpha-1,2-mannosidase